MNTKNFPNIKKLKQEEAVTRQIEYNQLTLEQKIERLPATGATKQRKRLLALMEKNK